MIWKYILLIIYVDIYIYVYDTPIYWNLHPWLGNSIRSSKRLPIYWEYFGNMDTLNAPNRSLITTGYHRFLQISTGSNGIRAANPIIGISGAASGWRPARPRRGAEVGRGQSARRTTTNGGSSKATHDEKWWVYGGFMVVEVVEPSRIVRNHWVAINNIGDTIWFYDANNYESWWNMRYMMKYPWFPLKKGKSGQNV